MSIFDSLNPLTVIKEAISGIGTLVDEASTTEEEKLSQKRKLFEAEMTMEKALLDYEVKMTEHKSKLVLAEIEGESWLQRNWRPLLMVVFMAMLVNNFILLPYIPGIEPLEFTASMWGLLTVGIGGYVGGRTYEKKKTKELVAPPPPAPQ